MLKKEIIDKILKVSCDLIKCKTIKENYKEFDKAYKLIEKELSNYNIKEIYVENYKNLVISNTDSKNLDLIFCGHIDVVPNEIYEPIINNNILYGRGSFDMKSQLAVITTLLKNNSSNKKIAFIITNDEEIGGYCCKEIIKDYNAKLAVIPDAGKNFKLITEEKGLLQIEIKVKGKKAHASEPFKGENAIIKAMKIYENILEKLPMPKNENDFKTSVNLSKLHSGNTNNTVPDEAIMVLDIRFTNEHTKDSIIDIIKNFNHDIEFKILDYGPTFYVDDKLKVIQDFITKSKEILGKKLEISKCLATSDAIYFSEKNIPTILINPIGDYWHSPDEYVEIDSLYVLYKLFETLI